jgi:hypothetical protein
MNMNCSAFLARCGVLIVVVASTVTPAALARAAVATQIIVEKVEPTPLFPRAEQGQPLRQRALLYLENRGEPLTATTRITVGESAEQIDPATIKTYAKDGNNEWADEDPPFAWALAAARRTGEMLPTTEKFATIASVLTSGGHHWTDIYQAYHSLLRYHKEANGAADWAVLGEKGAQYHETEQQEYREMVEDAAFFARRALDDALGRLAAAVTTEADRTLVVFNPMNRQRDDRQGVRHRRAADRTDGDPIP